MTLDRLLEGQRGRVVSVGGDREGLYALGLTPGTEIAAAVSAPWGDPTAYLFRGSLIALRRQDAAGIEIAMLAEEKKL